MSGVPVPVIASISLPVGKFVQARVDGFTFNLDTIWSTGVAALVVLALGLAVARSASKHVPGKLQLFWEVVVDAVQKQVEQSIGSKAGPVVPLAIVLFVFIFVANLLEIIPSGARQVALPSPTADINTPLAMAAVVFVVYTSAAFKHKGISGYFRRYLQPSWWLLPINVVEELVKPFTLSLRLFGNLFSGGLMIMLLSLLPAWISWLPTGLWKLFDMGIGVIQALIFSLLTILYYEAAVSAEGH
ncbi:MAG: F0F1 ATP synthase subunit A [Actinomycetota bacterium]|nr:F0F1 ATP synthase subunit A [Actinomycetota bacterium]